MQLTGTVLSWIKRVTAPLVGWDPRPLGLRDTLPDQAPPTSPRAVIVTAGAGARVGAVQVRPTPVGTCAK
jgi:hypothetical protein